MASGVNFGVDDYTVKVGLMAAPQGVEGDSAPPPRSKCTGRFREENSGKI
jgi:hypothetical protein